MKQIGAEDRGGDGEVHVAIPSMRNILAYILSATTNWH